MKTVVATARAADQPRPQPVRLPRLRLVLALPCLVTLVILGLLLIIAWISLHETIGEGPPSLVNYVKLYTDPFAYRTMLNTAGFAAVATAVSFAFGLPAAWLVERTDLRGKPAVFASMILGVLVPSFVTAIGWLLMFHPRIGAANQLLQPLLGIRTGPIDILTIPGMGFVQGVNLASLVFIMVSASLRAVDSSLEEGAQASGANFLAVLRRITLPLTAPALLAAAIYVFTTNISAFDVPAVIGLANRTFTFSTYLYYETHPVSGAPQYGLAAAFAAFMVVFALLLGWWYRSALANARRFQVVTGKGYRPRPTRLGAWGVLAWSFLALYILMAQVLPFLMLIWAALLPYLRPPSLAAFSSLSLRNFQGLLWPLVWRGLEHSLILMLGAPLLAMALSFAFSWVILRTRSRYRFLFDFVAFLPHAVPGAIFALGALFAALFLIRWPVDLYGTLTLLLLIYAVVYVSFGTRVTNGALMQLHPELEEAGAVSGAPLRIVLWRIVAPLLRPAFLYAWLWLALLTLRELTIASMLFSPQNITLPVVIWNSWNAGSTAQAAAVTLIMLGVLLPVVLLYWRFAGGGRLEN